MEPVLSLDLFRHSSLGQPKRIADCQVAIVKLCACGYYTENVFVYQLCDGSGLADILASTGAQKSYLLRHLYLLSWFFFVLPLGEKIPGRRINGL